MASRVPLIHPIIGDKIIGSSPWERWFTNISNILTPPNWDSTSFKPVFSGLTEVGTVNKSGNFIRHGEILYFDVIIDPEAGSSSASVLGLTSFLLPDLFTKLGADTKISASGYGRLNAFNVETPADLGMGYVEINTLNAFTPTWLSTGDKISITGTVRIEGL